LRATGEMPPETRTWFQQSVERIEKTDRFVADLWQSKNV
jgi:hypothetical protein